MFPVDHPILSFLPEGELATSLICTVGIGVMVTAFFNLRFGWLLSGLVVPGYLAPVLLASPITGFTIIFEGILTYFVTSFVSYKGAQMNLWSEFFGRDRFFALVLFSTVIKILFDFFILPSFGKLLYTNYNILFDYQNNLHSYGLVIIALISNQFWKRGLKGEFIPFAIALATTYLIIRYGLMEWSNYRITGISYLYNDLFLTFLGSSRAYIILLVTTMFASRMNLNYGWDFGGILVAGLLALEWYFPVRIIVTLFEAFLVQYIAIQILKTRFFGEADITRAHRVVLFFAIGFLYKFILSWVLSIYAPTVKIIDYFGFGYLLSTFIAITMHESHQPLRVVSILLQTSFVGMVIGTIISFVLTTIPYPEKLKEIFKQPEPPALTLFVPPQIQSLEPKKIIRSQGYLSNFILERKDKSAEKGTNLYRTPSPEDLYIFDKTVLTPLMGLINQDLDLSKLEVINSHAKQKGYTISLLDEGNETYIILAEDLKNPTPHYGAYFIFRIGQASPNLIEVPYSLYEVNTAEAGLYLFHHLKARGLIISNTHPLANLDGSANPIKPHNKNSYFNIGSQVVLREQGDEPFMLIQIRGFSPPDPFIPLKGTPSDADIFLALSTGAEPDEFTPLEKALYSELSQEKYKIKIVDNFKDTTGYDLTQMQSFRYLNQTQNKIFAAVWFSETNRTLFQPPDHNLLRLAHMHALEIPVQKAPLQQIIQKSKIEQGWKIPQEALDNLNNYIDKGDIIYLQKLKDIVSPKTLAYIIDPKTQGLYLLVKDQNIKKILQLWPKNIGVQMETRQ